MTSTQSRNRIAGFGPASETSHTIDHVKTGSRPLGTGLGNGSSTWMTGGSGSIWADSAYSANGKSGRSDSNQTQGAYSGAAARDINHSSRSLLSTTDPDNAAPRQNPWTSRDETSNLGSISASLSRVSPDQRQNSLAYQSSTFTDSTDGNSMFPFNKASNMAPSRPPHADRLRFDPTIEDFEAQGPMHNGHSQSTKLNTAEDSSYASRRGHFPPDLGQSFIEAAARNKSVSGYDSGIASRTNSLPPSRGDINLPSSSPHELPFLPPSRSGSNGINFPNGSQSFLTSHRPSQLGVKEQVGNPRLDSLAGQFDDLTVQDIPKKQSHPSLTFSPNSSNQYPSLRPLTGTSEFTQSWDEEYSSTNEQLSPTGSSSSFARQQLRSGLDGAYVDSPLDIESRVSHQSPFYSTNGTPPTLTHNQSNGRSTLPGVPIPAILDRRLRGLQQQQQQIVPPHHHHHHHHHNHNLPSFRNHMGMPFDVNGQQSFLNPYYQMNPSRHLFGNAQVSRGSTRDADPASQNRNPLLEEFKNSTKTNKRWELKDIYGSIVDFSGDQHGSRFVQQKLETANSDEKEQIFREILHDAYQLMTDIFGNYVIQKFFEHGNQVQKKTLAMQMKNRVFSLSLQTYGCRVVQKALEHVLTDQQADLVRELSVDVMKCVQDQNGNHVIQMAIQRVPAEHIDFIVNAFHRRVYENARNAYGCRVIQRMLEHCEEGTKQAVMHELHQCASALIPDQYGNYVTQHIIQHGSIDDRTKIIHLVIANLVNYSKHKFASNVVEKSIEFGTREERGAIVHQLTVTNERGDSAVQSLIRDQYGNYVVQKLLTQLQGQEWFDFAEPVKLQVALLKRFAYGKQVASVEKLLYRGNTPSHIHASGLITPTMDSSTAPTPALTSDLSQSPQSSSQPSTNANSVDAPHESSKAIGDPLHIFAGPP